MNEMLFVYELYNHYNVVLTSILNHKTFEPVYCDTSSTEKYYICNISFKNFVSFLHDLISFNSKLWEPETTY